MMMCVAQTIIRAMATTTHVGSPAVAVPKLAVSVSTPSPRIINVIALLKR